MNYGEHHLDYICKDFYALTPIALKEDTELSSSVILDFYFIETPFHLTLNSSSISGKNVFF
jgi:hypothetical protein